MTWEEGLDMIDEGFRRMGWDEKRRRAHLDPLRNALKSSDDDKEKKKKKKAQGSRRSPSSNLTHPPCSATPASSGGGATRNTSGSTGSCIRTTTAISPTPYPLTLIHAHGPRLRST